MEVPVKSIYSSSGFKGGELRGSCPLLQELPVEGYLVHPVNVDRNKICGSG